MLSRQARILLRRGTRALSTAAKPRVACIGAGWGGFTFAHNIDKSKYDVTVISPRNHFLFTPLLPSTAVGTLEFRCVQEPVRTIPGVHFHQAKVRELDPETKTVVSEDIFTGRKFTETFDKIVLCAGTQTNTFGVKGVEYGHAQKVFFLKQLQHARAIRNRIIECFERADLPDTTPEDRKRLLTFVIVGGGPISVEFAGELRDFLTKDVARWYGDLSKDVRVVLVEASDHLLGPFDERLVAYVEQLLQKKKFEVLTGTAVKEITPAGNVILGSGEEIKCGLVVWSTGVAPTRIMNKLKDEGHFAYARGRALMDSKMRILRPATEEDTNGSGGATQLTPHPSTGADPEMKVVGAPHDGIYGLGDCVVDAAKPLPTLGAIARMQAEYLASEFNKGTDGKEAGNDFKYTSLLQMSALGGGDAVIDPTISPLGKWAPVISGWIGKLVWASAYWGFQVSTTNKVRNS